MDRNSRITVHSHHFQINKLVDVSGNASSGWPFTFHNVLLCVALTRRIKLNDVSLLERQDSHVLPFSRSRSVSRLHTHTQSLLAYSDSQLHLLPFQFGSIIFTCIPWNYSKPSKIIKTIRCRHHNLSNLGLKSILKLIISSCTVKYFIQN